jgi:hypothetical protein
VASVEDGIAAQIRNIETRYGRPLPEWFGLIAASGLTQPSAAGRIDLGLILPGIPAGALADSRLEPAGSFNALFTHRVRVTSADDLDDTLAGWLAAACDGAG